MQPSDQAEQVFRRTNNDWLLLCHQRLADIRGEGTKVYSLDFSGSTYDCCGHSLVRPVADRHRKIMLGLSLQGTSRGKPRRAGRYFSFSLATQEAGLAYGLLECYYAVNTIGAEDAELAFVITAEVDETAVTLAGAG